jgi:hypothetical protein
MLLLSPRRANDSVLAEALRPLIQALDVTLMREADLRALDGNASPDTVARWLSQEVARRTAAQ